MELRKPTAKRDATKTSMHIFYFNFAAVRMYVCSKWIFIIILHKSSNSYKERRSVREGVGGEGHERNYTGKQAKLT